MWENARRLWNTVVKLKPEFTIPPSDPNPIHHFSTRSRRSGHNVQSVFIMLADAEQHSIHWPPRLFRRIQLLLRGQKLPASRVLGESAVLAMVEIPPVLGPLPCILPLPKRTESRFVNKSCVFCQSYRIKGNAGQANTFGGALKQDWERFLQFGVGTSAARAIGEHLSACARATVEIDPSLIMEDVQDFASLDSVYFSCVTSGAVGDDPNQNMMSDNYQEQEGQEDDARNFDHTILNKHISQQPTRYSGINTSQKVARGLPYHERDE
ncbi:hypothetical protein B0H13DRAFT_1866127 [Mycena leptocephala]|nr:hypothetical protein B0H13DRAFT_1866127 [Mycena leptocephala]